jgi:opacity protein-like surface antigen
VVGSRLVAALVASGVFFVCPARTCAQMVFTGLLTGHIGAASGGDVGGATTTGGASMAVIDDNGLGAEIDIGHTGGLDDDFFADGSVTSFMLNFIGVYPQGRFRPFVNFGAGVMRLHTTLATGEPTVRHTEAGWNAGGGLFYMVNDYFLLRGDLRYFRLFERPEELVLHDGGFFDYWRTSIGATFSWPMR